ncbi:hypothetical protein Ddc_20325 [Ditylenchus destructor]|nr:hypothetical protein Ddc_20325 [Ditylenchus destructor]
MGGTTICLFDGSPAGPKDAPDWSTLWRFGPLVGRPLLGRRRGLLRELPEGRRPADEARRLEPPARDRQHGQPAGGTRATTGSGRTARARTASRSGSASSAAGPTSPALSSRG